MAVAHVTFIQYYEYEVEISDELYEDNIEEAEEKAISLAKETFHRDMRAPVAHNYYDDVEIEFE